MLKEFEQFTQDQVQAARVFAANNPRRMAEEALTADYYADHVTMEDRQRIKVEKETLANEIENGLHDHNFTVVQQMWYYLTGESVALLK